MENITEALQTIRNLLARNVTLDCNEVDDLREAFAALEEGGLFEEADRWVRRHGWLPVPAHVEGKQVRRTATFKDVRLGGNELYMIVAETDEWVIVKTWNRHGTEAYPSNAYPLAEFNQKYERKEQP